MPHSLASPALDRPRKMISATLRVGETSGKKISDHEIARDFGRDVERALEIGSITPQALSTDLAFANATPISKVIHPEKASTLARMLKHMHFRRAYALALLESCEGVQMSTTVTVNRKAVNE